MCDWQFTFLAEARVPITQTGSGFSLWWTIQLRRRRRRLAWKVNCDSAVRPDPLVQEESIRR
jgi:hypothetical protein